MALKNSNSEFQKALKVMVGGVNSPVRAFKSVGGHPLVMDRGAGSKLYDIDGNSYTDYCLSWGALILGHGHKDVMAAVKKQISHAVSFGTTTKPEIEIAQWITKQVPSIDQIRFVNSGTEAAMSAVRLARGFTKRNLVVKFDGCYHGHFDDLLATAGSGVANLQASSSEGVPPGHIQNTISLPYNNVDVLAQTLERRKNEIACVIIEPVAGNMGVIVPELAFLKTLRDLTTKYKIVLIFDEVMTGFRTSSGGVQGDFGIAPDLTCLGKIIGGGFPVGAYGGRRDIMRHLSPDGGVYQAGTFAGNPIVMAAGLATLKNLTKSFYRALNDRSEKLAADFNRYFERIGVNVHCSHYKSMMSFRFRRRAVRNYEDARAASSHDIYGHFFHALLQSGIYLPPADLEAFFISGSHSAADLKEFQSTVEAFFRPR
jgi:glutamate-1-semialdehyde 2,1-aminomutase